MSEVYSPYPVAFGNEEEFSFHLPNRPSEVFSPDLLRSAFRQYRSMQVIEHGRIFSSLHDDTGGSMYVDNDHIERTSPESPTIEWLLKRMQGNEQFSEDMARVLLSIRTDQQAVGIHRRTIDGKGTTFGCHDNFGILNPNFEKLRTRLKPMMIGHSLARVCITGAGYSDGTELYFSQKLSGLKHIEDYGYKNSVFRVTPAEGTTRVEARTSDVNISADAARLRVGGMALAISLAQTHLAGWFNGFYYKHVDKYVAAGSLASAAKRFNRIPVDDGLLLVLSETLTMSAEYMMRESDKFASNAMKKHYGKQPPELLAIAGQQHDFAETLLAVASGKKHISVLSRESDWAAKHLIHQGRLERDRVDGKVRGDDDLTTRQDDLTYDYTEVRRMRNEKGKNEIRVLKRGTGYTLRDRKQHFRTRFTPEEVQDTSENPPKGGRAELRSTLLRDYEATEADWKYCKFANSYSDNMMPYIEVKMQDVRSNQLTTKEQSALLKARRRPRVEQKTA